MSYFSNVPMVPYKFGKSDTLTLHQNLLRYVDLIDTIRNNSAFYKKYSIIDGDRPDTLSQKLYGDTQYYWTFFLMNDRLRESGWPLDNYALVELLHKEKSNIVLTTKKNLTGIFKIGSIVIGQTSGAVGTIIKRKLGLGQLIVSTTDTFLSTENIITMEDEIIQSATLISATNEYDAIWRYENEDGSHHDFDPTIGPSANVVGVTYYDRYQRENNSLKDIVILKPSVVGGIFEKFQENMAN